MLSCAPLHEHDEVLRFTLLALCVYLFVTSDPAVTAWQRDRAALRSTLHRASASSAHPIVPSASPAPSSVAGSSSPSTSSPSIAAVSISPPVSYRSPLDLPSPEARSSSAAALALASSSPELRRLDIVAVPKEDINLEFIDDYAG
jgi:hypothetical protein